MAGVRGFLRRFPLSVGLVAAEALYCSTTGLLWLLYGVRWWGPAVGLCVAVPFLVWHRLRYLRGGRK